MRHCKTIQTVSVAPAGLRFAVYAVKAFPYGVCTVTMQPRLQRLDIVSRQPYRPFNRKPSRATELIWCALELRWVARRREMGEGKVAIEIIIRLKSMFSSRDEILKARTPHLSLSLSYSFFFSQLWNEAMRVFVRPTASLFDINRINGKNSFKAVLQCDG